MRLWQLAQWQARHGQDNPQIHRFDEMKADEYRYWQSRPVHERIAAVSEITQEQYALNGEAPDVPRLQRTLVRLNEHRVKYLIVGAYAVSIYAQPRQRKTSTS